MVLRVLGQVELHVAGQAIRIGAAKQRGLLSLLLLERGSSVSTDRLVDQLWEGDPPAAARVTVQSCVYRLRRLLREHDLPIRLDSTLSGGYLLDVPQGAVDIDQFDQSVAEGQRALESGEPTHAVSALRSGLELWRGGAFADIDVPAVREYATLLDERRLDATELCLTAELACGRHAVVAGELDKLTSHYPLRESLWRLRMLALVRSGRKAEALEAYRRLYHLLDDALGVEPSALVRELHRQILADDPTLAPLSEPSTLSHVPQVDQVDQVDSVDSADSTVGVGRVADVVPRMLPPTIDGFTGRREELKSLDQMLPTETGSGHRQWNRRPEAVAISAISGMAGVGKTALALHWAHRVSGQFPDGQLYVNLRGFHPSGTAMPPAEALRGLLDALRVPASRIPSELHGQIALYRSVLAGRRLLIVLDNAHDSQQVRPLLPGSPGCVVVVTSRNQLPGLVGIDAAKPLLLDLLSVEESRELIAGRIGHDRVDADPQAVDAIIAACAQLPLALAIVAARAATQPDLPLGVLAAELNEATAGLNPFSPTEPDIDIAADVRRVFSWSYRQLSAPAARLFRLLGLHPGPDISASITASLAGLPLRQTRTVLAELTGSHLLTTCRTGRYALHDLLRAYAAELADEEDFAEEGVRARRRLWRHYLETAHSAAVLVANPSQQPRPPTLPPVQAGVLAEPITDRQEAISWLTAERPALVAMVERAEGTPWRDHAYDLVQQLDHFLNLRGYTQDLLSLRNAALRLTHGLNQPAHAEALTRLAFAHTSLGEADTAHSHLEQALDLYTKLGDVEGQARTHRGFGLAHEARGAYQQALDHSLRSLELFRAAEDRIGEASALNNVGWYYAHLHNYRMTLAYCHQALAVFREHGRRLGEATTLDSLGYAHHHLGQHDQAREYYRQALRLRKTNGDRRGQAETLDHLGDTESSAGNHSAARRYWRQALSILEELGHRDTDNVRDKLAQRTG